MGRPGISRHKKPRWNAGLDVGLGSGGNRWNPLLAGLGFEPGLQIIDISEYKFFVIQITPVFPPAFHSAMGDHDPSPERDRGPGIAAKITDIFGRLLVLISQGRKM